MTSNFIDYVKINLRSGRGGSGSSHFRREKHVPKGGPDGGDGGRGGHIYLVGTTQQWTLLHLKYQKHIIADSGNGGEGGRRSGSEGADVFIEVPLGTIVKDAETDEFLAEVTEDGQKVLLVPGGRGGLGNTHFKTSTNQSPRHAQPGEAGIERWVIMELKVLADVGLVGFPNAGKSTLLSVISEAKPEIADYPFTTLVPNLGVVAYRDYKSFVVADIPGIIEGAADGKGLGIRFLRHIERNSILLFLIPVTSENIKKEYSETVPNTVVSGSDFMPPKIFKIISNKQDNLSLSINENKSLSQINKYVYNTTQKNDLNKSELVITDNDLNHTTSNIIGTDIGNYL
jgi:GTP-binding protein